MNRFIFIPGKNPNLSLAELVSWFDLNGYYFRIAETGEGFIIVEAEKVPEADDLGGMIKVCRLLESFDKKPLLHPGSIFNKIPAKYLPKERLFGLSVYPSSRRNNRFFNSFASALKKNLREAGVNGKFMPIPKDRSALTHVEVIKRKLEEIVVCMGRRRIHVAKTVSVHSPFAFQKRDIGRPSQRPMFSIPPRLARIMINLSQTRRGGKVILDPFCGMGTILQEASLMGFDILGTDIDEECALATIENLYWLSQDYKLSLSGLDKRIMRVDATKLSKVFQPKSIDMIVTEPSLGPPLKIAPDRNKAEGIIRGLKPLYQKSLQEFSAILKPGGRVCMVFPRFEFGEHFARPETEKLATRAGLRPVDILARHNIQGTFPYIDKEERHKTIREIWVFEKPASTQLVPKPPADLAMEKA